MTRSTRPANQFKVLPGVISKKNSFSERITSASRFHGCAAYPLSMGW